ncbi:shikimate dehydrogenase [Virgibacillus xinjiangensis]|uniref:Shikimate dehydrogenase (NADP(+)) n=1 Tax=Virgibacillus xinjiangensis TaxID=393090 RepID=A0ABV7CRS1_9BACI
MDLKLALIGTPIQHSLSPWIHQQFLEKAGMNGEYQLFEILPEESFEDRVMELKGMGVDGFNVTVPYKQKIFPFLDEVDKNAVKAGAVNTVVRRNGKWIGYNTDGTGFLRSLKTYYPSVNPSMQILLIGGGGATRGIYYAMAAAGYENIDIANRTTKKAEEIAELSEGAVHTTVLDLDNAQEQLKKYDVIIQTTSVGMKPYTDHSIMPLDGLKQGAIVSDIVYQPLKTAFLLQADELGADTHLGHTMLLYQAQHAFEIWTGKNVDVEEMDNKLMKILEG